MTLSRKALLDAAAAGQAAYFAGDPFTACPFPPGGGKEDRLRAAAWLQAYRRAEAAAAPALTAAAHRALTASCEDHPCQCLGCDEFDCGLDACACCWVYDENDTLVRDYSGRYPAETAGGHMTAAAPETTPPAEAPPADAPTPPAPDENGEVRWPFTSVLTVEGIKTGDGRKFTNLTLADFPMPWRTQFSEQPGHDDARLTGRIESAVIQPDGQVLAHGTWDDETLNPDAAEARRHNLNGQMRGVSMDADQGTIQYEDADGNVLDFDALMNLGPDDEVVFVVDGARIRAATQCMIPAFVEAYVLDDTILDQAPTATVTASGVHSGLALTAAALVAEPEVHGDAAPASAFDYPGVEALSLESGAPRGLTVTDDGRVYGYAATWGTCHIGIPDACVTPPRSATSYAHFLTGAYRTREGTDVAVGVLTMDTGHAAMDLPAGAAVAHYDNTGTAAAWVNMGEDDTGIWFAGVLDEDLPLPKRRTLSRVGKVSGDWRTIGASLEFVACLAVNVAGFPIPKVQTRVASGVPQAMVASGIVTTSAPVTEADLARLVGPAVDRALRRRDAAARIRRARARSIVASIRHDGR